MFPWIAIWSYHLPSLFSNPPFSCHHSLTLESVYKLLDKTNDDSDDEDMLKKELTCICWCHSSGGRSAESSGDEEWWRWGKRSEWAAARTTDLAQTAPVLCQTSYIHTYTDSHRHLHRQRERDWQLHRQRDRLTPTQHTTLQNLFATRLVWNDNFVFFGYFDLFLQRIIYQCIRLT